jgi:sulfatase maturation enzyme AslB (radical SAM superfamily)
VSDEDCGHLSIAEYETFDECKDCLRRWPKKAVSDDTDKAARECGDCAYFPLCEGLIRRKPSDRECDWEPSRFRQRMRTKG